jgi:hypothetical protein
MRPFTVILLALVAAACLAAMMFAGAVLWRLAPTLISERTSTPTPARGAPPTGDADGAFPTELPPASGDEGLAEGSLTDPELRSQVWSTIVSFYANVRGCTDVSSRGIRVSREPDAIGSWEETWDVSACAAPAALKINFTVAPDGGIFYDITE